MNRDTITRPNQAGGRTADDYGHTNLERAHTRHSRAEIACTLAMLLPVVTWIVGRVLS